MCLIHQEVKFISTKACKRNEDKKTYAMGMSICIEIFSNVYSWRGYSTGTTLDFGITTHLTL